MKRPTKWFPHAPPDDDDERPSLEPSDMHAIKTEALRFMADHTNSKRQRDRARLALKAMGEWQ